MNEFNKELCDERHLKMDEFCREATERHTKLEDCLTKKFNQILGWIIVTLLSVVGSMIAIIITRPKG